MGTLVRLQFVQRLNVSAYGGNLYPTIFAHHLDGDCGEKKLPFNRKKPLEEPESGRVTICLDELGVERTGKRGQQNTVTPFKGYLLIEGNAS